MIKRYNQFVKGKVNEEFVMAEPSTTPDTTRVRPDTIEKPGTMPTTPTPIRRERTSPVPAPAKAEIEQDSMEEEGGEYMGTQMLQNLADSLGTEVVDNSVEYNGKKVNFYSETEMFHVDKKKFKTVEEVVDYLESSTPSDNKSMEEENTDMLDRQENSTSKEDMVEDEERFESKSYKSTRKFESFKNKKK